MIICVFERFTLYLQIATLRRCSLRNEENPAQKVHNSKPFIDLKGQSIRKILKV
eukprot:GAHX01006517.1.p1 GENE.GAHX01006517.1~~GAHX01006517.1.p1  ORF type:complete len:54 (+),score=0.79 GAHX01006517.1:17-178(+)